MMLAKLTICMLCNTTSMLLAGRARACSGSSLVFRRPAGPSWMNEPIKLIQLRRKLGAPQQGTCDAASSGLLYDSYETSLGQCWGTRIVCQSIMGFIYSASGFLFGDSFRLTRGGFRARTSSLPAVDSTVSRLFQATNLGRFVSPVTWRL